MPDRTAYHEAGHAFMAVILGGRVEHVTIAPDHDDGPDRYGDTLVSWPASGLNEHQLCERDLQVCLAGPVAEMIYRGEPFHPGLIAEWAADWQQAWELAMRLRPGNGEEQNKQRLRWLEQVTVDLYHFLSGDRNWAALAAIVDHLLAHERLEDGEVEELVAAWISL